MVWRPSRSWRTSSGVRPWVEFQYCEETTGIRMMVQYLLRRSKVALAPPRRQVTTQAPNLPAKASVAE